MVWLLSKQGLNEVPGNEGTEMQVMEKENRKNSKVKSTPYTHIKRRGESA